MKVILLSLISLVFSTQVMAGWTLIANGPANVKVFSDWDTFALQSDGKVYRYMETPHNWQRYIVPSGETNNIKVASSANSIYIFQSTGIIWKWLGTPTSWLDIGTSSHNRDIVATNDTVYVLQSADMGLGGHVYQYQNPGWTKITTSTEKMSQIAADVQTGFLYGVRHYGGFPKIYDERQSPPIWESMGGHAKTKLIAGHSQVYNVRTSAPGVMGVVEINNIDGTWSQIGIGPEIKDAVKTQSGVYALTWTALSGYQIIKHIGSVYWTPVSLPAGETEVRHMSGGRFDLNVVMKSGKIYRYIP